MSTRRTVLAAVSVALTAAAALVAGQPGQAAPHAAVEVLTSRPAVESVPKHLEKEFGAAQDAVRSRGEVLAPPYVAGGKVVVPAVGAAANARQGLRGRVVSASRSAKALEKIQNEIIEAAAAGKLLGGKGVYVAYVDAPRNRVLVETGSVNDELTRTLAARYGTSSVAVLHVKGGTRPVKNARHNDTAPFYGGGQIHLTNRTTKAGQACTAGFAWDLPAEGAVLTTAGHCIDQFVQDVTTPAGTRVGVSMGGADSTWWSTAGTVQLPRNTPWSYGDIGIVRLEGRGAGGRIFVGPVGLDRSVVVRGMATTRNTVGAMYCVSGATTGETCAWQVTAVNASVAYVGGAVGRNLTGGTSLGGTFNCTAGGDSGAPVFQYENAQLNSVRAYGVHSAGAKSGNTCVQYFTDMYTFRDAFGGSLRTASF